MLINLYAEDISSDISLPNEGWETVSWYRSWSNISDDVYYHLVRIYQVHTEIKPLFQAHFQLFKNNRVRRYDILEEMIEQY